MRADLPPSTTDANSFTRYWMRWTALLWLGTVVALVALRWQMIDWFNLPDTDDNMRMMQVRGLLHGQGWYDLRQHAMNPPIGANIHWSRLVDLPIAGLILLFSPLGSGNAERTAAAIAPTLPLLLAMISMGALVRRLVHPFAYLLAVFLIWNAYVAMGMFSPLRIDHHGWQLALLVTTLTGIADENRSRGGLIAGIASAASLSIGLEMIAFLALGGAAIVLRWVGDGAEAPRVRSYGLSLAAGCAVGYYGFASYDNARAVCDALSPVWLSVMVGAGGLAALLSFAATPSSWLRLVLAGVAGALILFGFVHFWPDCIGRPEHVSPEVDRIWLSNVREAKPIYTQDRLTMWNTIALPLAGLVGVIVALWQARRSTRVTTWATLAAFMVAAFALLIWQTRMGPATQLIAIPGAVALAWALVPALQASRVMPVRVLGTFATFLFVSGIGVSTVAAMLTPKNQDAAANAHAPDPSRKCPTIPAMTPLNRLPSTTIFTHVDLGPRLITLTHHRAIAGPYHRNGDAILDVYHAFGGSADKAHTIMAAHGATLLLICPGMSETTVYRARWPHGFYTQLIGGQVPDWLTPVPLPAGSPFKLWAITPLSPSGASTK